jgi:hypothetical protein
MRPSLSRSAQGDDPRVMVAEIQSSATGGWGVGQFKDGKPADEALHRTCFPCQNLRLCLHPFRTRKARRGTGGSHLQKFEKGSPGLSPFPLKIAGGDSVNDGERNQARKSRITVALILFGWLGLLAYVNRGRIHERSLNPFAYIFPLAIMIIMVCVYVWWANRRDSK